ncbi:GIY-YIG nuclease family protein [Fibrobacter sp.]|uniref:GIY-YIG nuclease family protein n=1 Tax=Fibrobacter sp. TaxID=35828 RepID=UPI00388F4034
MSGKIILKKYSEKEQPILVPKLEENSKYIDTEAGCYKWWAKWNELDKIINHFKCPELEFEKIEPELEFFDSGKERYYCIYVGKAAVGKTTNLRVRVVKKHIKGKVRYSTLRKTIGSLMRYYKCAKPEDKIVEFIRELYVQPIYLKGGDLNTFERGLINEKQKRNEGKTYFRILNYMENEHKLAEKSKPIIETARRSAENDNPAIFKRK